MEFDLIKNEANDSDFRSVTEILLFDIISEVTSTVIDNVANDFLNAYISKEQYVNIDKNKLIMSLKNTDNLNLKRDKLKKNISYMSEKDIYNAAVSIGVLTAFNMVCSSLEIAKESGGSIKELKKNLI